MNAIPRELDAKTQAILNQHLDAIERVLVEAGLSRQERRNVCDEVESHATEMFWERVDESQPSEQQMAAVIAELDDPEAYSDVETLNVSLASKTSAEAVRLHPFTLWAILAPILGLMVMFTPVGPKSGIGVAFWFGLLIILPVIFSAIAVGDIRRHPNRFYGIKRAMFGDFEESTAVFVLHPFALWSLLISIIGCVFLIFTQLGSNSVGSLLMCGILTVVSIALATFAIRDIHHQPDRYYGTNLALCGASIIPIFLCLSIIVVS